MTVAESPVPLTEELCHGFAAATGWGLSCREVEPGRDVSPAESGNPDCAWQTVIGEPQRPTGILALRRGTADPRVSEEEAVALARPLAELLSRAALAARELALRNADVSLLLHLGQTLPAQDRLPAAVNQLLSAAAHLTNSRAAALFLLDPELRRLSLRAVYHMAREDVPAAERDILWSAPDRLALCEGPVCVSGRGPAGHSLLPVGMRKGMVASLQSAAAPFGTLWVYDRRAVEYTTRDRSVLESLVAQAAGVLERAALLRGDEQQQRVCRDLKEASANQPDQDLRGAPCDPRFDLAARTASCYELGGDLYEVMPLSEDRTAIVVGDASGNSIPAAMIMSAVRGALRTHVADEDEVASLMGKINSGLCDITSEGQFMSLCYCVFDAGRRRFTYCNAGHPVPLLIREGAATELESHGMLLGVLNDATYGQDAVELHAGDLLVFYSDGISEGRDAQSRMFRTEGIARAARQADGATAQGMLEAIWDAAERHLAADQPPDDRTLLVLRMR